jgi:hypothetical protein
VKLSPWRTVIAIEVLGLDLLVGLLIVCAVPDYLAVVIGTVFVAFAGAVVGLGGVLGTKSAVEHLAGGSGVKGAVAALMTDAKPGEEKVQT